MNNEIILKKNIVGGFNRKQVIDCIVQIKKDCANKVSVDEIEATKNTIDTYTEMVSLKDVQIKELRNQLDEINSSKKDKSPSSAVKSISEANQTVTAAKKRAEEITNTVKAEIENKSDKLDSIFTKLTLINNEIERIKNVLSEASEKISDININCETESNTIISDDIKQSVTSKAHEKEQNIIKTEVAENQPTEDITEFLIQTEENFNSIDNFFAELYKMTNGKLFEQRQKPNFDTSDDFEYEY